jgi:hypothetical protein
MDSGGEERRGIVENTSHLGHNNNMQHADDPQTTETKMGTNSFWFLPI